MQSIEIVDTRLCFLIGLPSSFSAQASRSRFRACRLFHAALACLFLSSCISISFLLKTRVLSHILSVDMRFWMSADIRRHPKAMSSMSVRPELPLRAPASPPLKSPVKRPSCGVCPRKSRKPVIRICSRQLQKDPVGLIPLCSRRLQNLGPSSRRKVADNEIVKLQTRTLF